MASHKFELFVAVKDDLKYCDEKIQIVNFNTFLADFRDNADYNLFNHSVKIKFNRYIVMFLGF